MLNVTQHLRGTFATCVLNYSQFAHTFYSLIPLSLLLSVYSMRFISRIWKKTNTIANRKTAQQSTQIAFTFCDSVYEYELMMNANIIHFTDAINRTACSDSNCLRNVFSIAQLFFLTFSLSCCAIAFLMLFSFQLDFILLFVCYLIQ